jgi:uncharacterized repeat protein (TIGR01451 family)
MRFCAWHVRVLLLGLVVLLLQCSNLAIAQTATITATNGQTCAAQRFGSSLNCTANDFSSTLTFGQPAATTLTSCVAGSTVFIDVLATVTSNSPLRYDGAFFLGEVGNSPSTFSTTATCSLGVFPTAPLPYLNSDSDACGDYSASATSTLLMQHVAVKCAPTAGSNSLALPYTLVFSNSNAVGCTAANITASTTAKCVSSTSATVTGVVIDSYVTIIKKTNPLGDPQSFNYSAATNSASGISASSFALTDTQSQTVRVPLSSSGASHTITVTEAAAGGWYPDASITCLSPTGGVTSSYVTVNNSTRTIVATLNSTNYGATCTFTNTKQATFALQKKTLGGTGGAFSFGQTDLASAPSAISTTAINTATPTSPTAINVTATGVDVTITETAPSAYVATAATCTDAKSAVTGNPASFGSLSGSVLTVPLVNVKGGAEINCVLTNSKIPTVKVQKTTVGGVGGAFTFSSVNLASTPSGITTTAVNTATPSLPTAINVSTIGSQVQITETITAGFAFASASCTDANSIVTGNPSSFGSLSGTTLTIPAGNVLPGADINCVFTNNKIPTIKVQKITQGGTGGAFTFTQTNLASAPGGITTTSANTATPTTPTAINVSAIGVDVTLTEGAVASYSIYTAACTDANSAVTGNTGSIGSLSGSILTIPAARVLAGSDFTCVFTNRKDATVKVQKITSTGTGTFSFSQSNLASAISNITTTGPTATPASPTGIKVSALGTAVTITEGLASGFNLVSAVCTDANSAVTGNSGSIGTVSTTTLTIPVGNVLAGADFTCVFTNTTLPRLQLIKVSNGGVGTFTFAGTLTNGNGFGSDSVVTTAAGAPGTAGAAKTLTAASTITAVTETLPSGWSLTGVTCSGMGSGGSVSVSGNTFTLNAAATASGSNILCTVTNFKPNPALSLTKTASPTSVSAAGAVISYTVAVSNTGNVTITSITVTDPLGTAVCAVSGNATISSLAAGSSQNCTVSYAATQADFNSNGGGDGKIDNTAAAAGSYGAASVNGSASAAVTLNLDPKITVLKTPSTTGPVAVGTVITYTYKVTNTGNVTMLNVKVTDAHGGYGTAPIPGGEVMMTDTAPIGDSTDAAVNKSWDSLAPGDVIKFTATYSVVQQDIDLLQ